MLFLLYYVLGNKKRELKHTLTHSQCLNAITSTHLVCFIGIFSFRLIVLSHNSISGRNRINTTLASQKNDFNGIMSTHEKCVALPSILLPVTVWQIFKFILHCSKTNKWCYWRYMDTVLCLCFVCVYICAHCMTTNKMRRFFFCFCCCYSNCSFPWKTKCRI